MEEIVEASATPVQVPPPPKRPELWCVMWLFFGVTWDLGGVFGSEREATEYCKGLSPKPGLSIIHIPAEE